MKLLLDTHALLWFVLDDPALSGRARTMIEDDQADVLISPASIWEVAIKVRTWQVRFKRTVRNFLGARDPR